MNDTINRVIVPGTFDPITFGSVISTASKSCPLPASWSTSLVSRGRGPWSRACAP